MEEAKSFDEFLALQQSVFKTVFKNVDVKLDNLPTPDIAEKPQVLNHLMISSVATIPPEQLREAINITPSSEEIRTINMPAKIREGKQNFKKNESKVVANVHQTMTFSMKSSYNMKITARRGGRTMTIEPKIKMID
jgi:hypothetical protein